MYKEYLKRVIDCICSCFLFILISPLFLIIAVAIKCTSKGSVFYKQKRVGKEGETFGCLKFRTMIQDADKVGAWYTSKNDNRITKIGGILRKTSLDELPQIINIIKGDMSFVGPRPNVIQQLEDYTIDQINQRNSLKPGLTGLAQVKGRSQLSFEKRLEYDLDYVKNCSFILDITILVNTVLILLKKKNAW
ncbi:sugar transferase [Lysinibacillus sp. NPDC096418]|uniref:sugar transferase n=1 Tax=Lysinibacillus sp. NPDC096418 TaxID=3364138 RepID=UPI00382CCE21